MDRTGLLRFVGMTIIILTGASQAFAWNEKDCQRVNNDHPDCVRYQHSPSPPPPAPTPTMTNESSSASDASASSSSRAGADANAQAVGKGGNAKATGGAVRFDADLNVEASGHGGKGGNAKTGPVDQKAVQGQSIDARNQSSSATKTTIVALPSIMPPMPSFASVQGDIKQERHECGPLQSVRSTDVNGVFFGLTTNEMIFIGTDDRLEPYAENGTVKRYHTERTTEEDGSTHVRRYGHQPTITTTALTTTGARQIGGGGYGTNGGGMLGLGTSGSMSRLVSTIQLRDCELPGSYKVIPIPPHAEAPPAEKSALELNVPTARAVTERVPCPYQKYTDAKGNPVYGCLTQRDTWSRTRIERGTATLRVSPTDKNAQVTPITQGVTVERADGRFAVVPTETPQATSTAVPTTADAPRPPERTTPRPRTRPEPRFRDQ